AEVRELVSSATLRISARGTRETRITERTRRLLAMHICGRNSTPGNRRYSIDGISPTSTLFERSRSGILDGGTRDTSKIPRYGPLRKPQVSGWALTNGTEAIR